MSYKVFGNKSYSRDDGNKTDTSLFVQILYLRTNYTESNIEENIDIKNQFRNKNLPHRISIREAASKRCVENNFYDPGVI